jgi:peptide/nickel transport system substrate-binding protein/oligopeptide transport system substrate-binding protein
MSLRNTALRAGVLSACLLVLTASCTPDEGPQEGPDARATTAPDESVAPIEGATPDAFVASFEDERNVLDVAVNEPNSLDPMRVQDPASVLIIRQLYEGLTRWDAAAEQVRPAAAETIEVSDDARTFTFTLRDDATFHNGDQVTAQDFAFAFDRIALKSNGADIAYLLELVVGFDEVNAFGDAKSLRGIRTPDDRTLVIELSEPYANFPAVLTHPSLVPLPEDAFKASDDFSSQPVGNGPFEMAQPFELGAAVALRAVEGHFQAPGVEGIRFLPFPDAASSWVPFTNDQLDITEVPTTRIEQASENFGDDGFVPLLVGSYYGFNLEADELGDPRKRRAINLAIDRVSLAEDIFAETLQAPRGIVPVGMPGFTGNACGELCRFDLKEAKRLVRTLPKRDRKLTLEYTREPLQGQVARRVRNNLQAAGLDVRLRAYPFNRYLERLSDGDHSMFRLGWIGEYPDPHVFLSTLFESDSPDNHTGFDSERVDSLLAKAQRETDEAARLGLYQRTEELILEQIPIAPVGSFRMFWAAAPAVQGVEFDVLGGFDAAGVSLEG